MKSIGLTLGVVGWSWLLAEARHVPDLGNLTATGLLGWYAWHTVSRTIPGLVTEFRAELSAKRQESATDRETFCKELREERLQRHAEQMLMVQSLQDLTAALQLPAGNIEQPPRTPPRATLPRTAGRSFTSAKNA